MPESATKSGFDRQRNRRRGHLEPANRRRIAALRVDERAQTQIADGAEHAGRDDLAGQVARGPQG